MTNNKGTKATTANVDTFISLQSERLVGAETALIDYYRDTHAAYVAGVITAKGERTETSVSQADYAKALDISTGVLGGHRRLGAVLTAGFQITDPEYKSLASANRMRNKGMTDALTADKPTKAGIRKALNSTFEKDKETGRWTKPIESGKSETAETPEPDVSEMSTADALAVLAANVIRDFAEMNADDKESVIASIESLQSVLADAAALAA